MNQDDIYYRALTTRDHRFDGKFFVGVKTTGIYCRPICPAKPKRENVEFFSNHLAAERAGYRPCLRCRPESAPRSSAWIGKSAVVRRALKMLGDEENFDFDEDQFAEHFGVSSRHLRRLFMEEIGKTPKQIATENRLNLARKLLLETHLPVSEIAFVSGFRSIRRFNDSFLERFKKKPSEVRRKKSFEKNEIVLSLPYRPPFDFQGLLHFYRSHQVGLLENFTEDSMCRIVEIQGKIGQILMTNDPRKSQLLVKIDFPQTAAIHSIVSRVRSLFDLDSDPLVVANALEVDPKIKSLLKKHPGVRLPSGWDPFEVAISSILGQLVSVERGRSLVGDLIEMTGRESGLTANGKSIKLFPTPEDLMNADLTSLKTTGARKQTLKAFARAIHENKISLESAQDLDNFMEKVLSVKGIGPWTANFIAMKALRSTDAFPSNDLILARALKFHPQKVIDRMQPWRSYAAVLLWKEYGGKK